MLFRSPRTVRFDLTEARAVLALGGFAWASVKEAAQHVYGVEAPRTPFAHGACAPLGPGHPMLWASFHPSPQNTNTGKLTHAMLVDLLQRIRASYAPGRPGTRGES